MDPLQIKRLKEEHIKGLSFCEEKIEKWEKFKADYEALQQRLQTLPDHISYDITVPFGNNAFSKGKLVHTNEIMVLLGDNWFAEVSAKQAAAIAMRRITQCTKMLEDLEKEKEQFENWLSYIGEVSGNEELVEIVEDYDEEREKEWKEQHAKNVKSYRQQLATKNQENSPVESPDNLLSKLENLEITETNGIDESEEEEDDTSKSELDSKVIESVGSIDCSDDGSHSEEHSEKPVLKLQINCNRRRTSESETGDDWEDNRKKDSNSNLNEESTSKNGKHVRWQDLSRQNIKKITFKHSKPKKPNTPSSKYKAIDYNEDENHPLIQSPSDIYKHFGNFFQSSPPKSILKVKTPSPTTDMNGPIFPTKDSTSKETSPEIDENVISQPFTGEVRECSSPIDIVENKSSRPTSHFKSSRKNRKR